MGSNPISPNLIFLRPGTVLSVGHMHPIMNIKRTILTWLTLSDT